MCPQSPSGGGAEHSPVPALCGLRVVAQEWAVEGAPSPGQPAIFRGVYLRNVCLLTNFVPPLPHLWWEGNFKA